MTTSEYEPDDRVQQALDELPRELPPQRDLWPEIARKVAAAPAGPWWSPAVWPGWVGTAVAALLVVAVSIGVMQRAAENRVVEPKPGPDVATEESCDTRIALAGHQRTRVALEGVLEDLPQDLDPETVAEIRNNLELIDEAMANIIKAVEDDPGNARLFHRLARTQREQLGLLAQASQLAQGI